MSDDHSTHSHTQGLHHIKKKRVGKACDSCRIKKTKCDSKKPCNRCTLDNKICVFTEKKKTKEKKHPSGYVELLEARLDILTRLLEKLIELSRPHLQFIDEIITEEKLVDQDRPSPSSSSPNSSSGDHEDVKEQSTASVVPINKVVTYLIKEQGLLKNIPLEWEQGTEIAANFDPNKNLKLSSRLFAEHNGETFVGSPVTSPQQMPTNNPLRRTSIFREDLESPSSDHYNELIFSQSNDEPYIKQEPNSDQFSKGTMSLQKQQQQHQQQQQTLNQFSLNTFRDISDVESDSSNKEDGLNSGSVSPPTYNYRSFSLFSDSNGEPILGKTSSLSSLTNKYENHSLSSPQTAINPVFNNSNTGPIFATLRRNSSSHSQKTLGSIQVQQKPKGSVHKPVHNHSRVSSFDKRMESTANAVVATAATAAAVSGSGSVQLLQNTTQSNLTQLDTNQNNNYLRDNRKNNNNIDGLSFGDPNFVQSLSPSDDAIVYPTNQFTNRPATVSNFGGGLDVLVDNSFDPFFNNNSNPFMGKF